MDFKAFIGGSNESQAVTADQQRTINWYPEILDVEGSTRPSALYPTPGVVSLDDSAVTGKSRAHVVIPCGNGNCVESQSRPERMPPFLTDGREFLVIGNALYEANSDGELFEWTSSALNPGPDNAFEGSVNPSTSTEPATINHGFDPQKDVFLTSHGVGYYFGMTGTIVHKVVDLDGFNVTMGGFLDGYFLALDTDNNKFYSSNLNDLNTWDTGTDFAGRSLAPDPWRSMKVYGRYIWLFGERTTEIWQDTGERFPFAPIPSALINYGIAAPWSAQIVDNSLVWLARNEAGRICVIRANGTQIETISTRAVELAINSYSDYGDARADTYSEAGHDFYVLHFDDSGHSHAWDAKSNLWHERGTWDSAARKFTAARQRFPVYAFRELRCLDSGADQPVGKGNPSQLYRMGVDLTGDIGGGVIRRVRRAPALQSENKRLFYSKLELDFEPGLMGDRVWTPLELKPSLWLVGDDLGLADAADVTEWPDVSGNARHLDTSVGTQTFATKGLNGHSVVTFGDDGYLSAAGSAVQMDDILDSSGQGSMFAVAYIDADHTVTDRICGSAGRLLAITSADDVFARAFDGGADDATLAGTYVNGWHLFVWQYDGTNVSAFADDIDDAAAATAASGTQTLLETDFTVGGDGSNEMKGQIAEVLIVPGDVSEENHRRIAYYLAERYALTAVTASTTSPVWTDIDPQAMLRMSNDGGKTWGSEVWRSAGKLGEYEKRVRWLRLGSGRRRVFEVAVSDRYPWRLVGSYLDVTDGGA